MQKFWRKNGLVMQHHGLGIHSGKIWADSMNYQKYPKALWSLIEEHACLNFSDFHSTLLAIFYVVGLLRSACLLGTSE